MRELLDAPRLALHSLLRCSNRVHSTLILFDNTRKLRFQTPQLFFALLERDVCSFQSFLQEGGYVRACVHCTCRKLRT